MAFCFCLLQGLDPAVYETKVCQGRVVYLKPPDEEDDRVVRSGIAVIDSGPHTGQRIEFEARQCFLFGYCLARANLSFILQTSKFLEQARSASNSYKSSLNFCTHTKENS